MVYPALLPLMRTPRLPVVDWTDNPHRFKLTRPFPRRTNCSFCACDITFQLTCTPVFNLRARGGGLSTPCPGFFTPGNNAVAIIWEAGWPPGQVWTCAENLDSTGIRSPYRAALSVLMVCSPYQILRWSNRELNGQHILDVWVWGEVHAGIQFWCGRLKEETIWKT